MRNNRNRLFLRLFEKKNIHESTEPIETSDSRPIVPYANIKNSYRNWQHGPKGGCVVCGD